MIIVCRPTSWRYALCALGLRTVETAVSPVYTARILRLREFCTTKKKPVKDRMSIHLGRSRTGPNLTSKGDAEQHTSHKVAEGHTNHDRENGNVLGPSQA